MINPFESNQERVHLPGNISEAFEEIAAVSTDTALLLASKAKFYSSESTNKYHTPESSLNIADLVNSDTFAISKSSAEEAKSLQSDSKSLKPPIKKNHQKVIHCTTCKCMELSNFGVSSIAFKESESLKYLSKLESLPMPYKPFPNNLAKPYSSPIYKLPSSPSQIFRQRINSHVIHMKAMRQASSGNIFLTPHH